MTVAARRIDPDVWTKDQFLAWINAQPGDTRHEFDGAHPVAMAPATTDHNDIARNIRDTIRAKLPAETRCKVYGPQQPIETVGGALREPDAFVACSKRVGKAVAISAPVVVFEVLSPGKENQHRDKDIKVDEYGSVPTILRYGIVESESRGVYVFWRNPGEREWRREPLDSVGPLHVPEFGITLTFDEIYEEVEFD